MIAKAKKLIVKVFLHYVIVKDEAMFRLKLSRLSRSRIKLKQCFSNILISPILVCTNNHMKIAFCFCRHAIIWYEYWTFSYGVIIINNSITQRRKIKKNSNWQHASTINYKNAILFMVHLFSGSSNID